MGGLGGGGEAQERDDAAKCAGNGGNCISALTRPVGWLDARDWEGTTRQAPPKWRREVRNLVGMRVRPEEDALTRLLPYHGLDSKDASEAYAWVRGQLDWRNRVQAVGSP